MDSVLNAETANYTPSAFPNDVLPWNGRRFYTVLAISDDGATRAGVPRREWTSVRAAGSKFAGATVAGGVLMSTHDDTTRLVNDTVVVMG